MRILSLGSLVTGAGLLFSKAVSSGQDCIGDGKCRVCLSLKKCELPLVKEYRKTIDPKSLIQVKGSLSYKRDLLIAGKDVHHG